MANTTFQQGRKPKNTWLAGKIKCGHCGYALKATHVPNKMCIRDRFKLNSNEFALEIQSVEAAELTRNILIDWIPIFEDKQVEYDIDIPEQPVRVRLDMDS